MRRDAFASLTHLFIIVVALLGSSDASAAEERLSRASLERQAGEIDSMLLAKQFDNAESAVQALLSPTAPRTRIDDSPIFTVSGALFQPSVARYQSVMELWVRERPKSALAWALYAKWLHDWAWEARGTKFIESVPGEASKLYQERLRQTVDALARAEALEKNNILIGYLRLTVAKETGSSASEQRALFEALNKVFPNSWAIHSEYLQGLAPKWGGESEQHLFSEARRLAAAAPKSSPIVAAPIVAQNLMCAEHGGKRRFLADAAHWNEREQSYKALLSRFPSAGYFAATYAADAFLLGKDALGSAQLKIALEVEADNPEVVSVQKRYGARLSDSGTDRSKGAPILEAAKKAYREKNLPEAERLYRQATEIDPSRANSWHILGSTIAQQGRYKDAVPALVRATELSPKTASYFTQLCHARMMSGDLQQGIEDCTRAIAIDSSEKYAYLNRGQAYRMLGKVKEAEADFKVGNSIK